MNVRNPGIANFGITVIQSRHSVRKFKDEEIPPEFIRKALECASKAPTGRNKQPWIFVVIKNKETLAKIAELAPNGKFIEGAAVGILWESLFSANLTGSSPLRTVLQQPKTCFLPCTPMDTADAGLQETRCPTRMRFVSWYMSLRPTNSSPLLQQGYPMSAASHLRRRFRLRNTCGEDSV